MSKLYERLSSLTPLLQGKQVNYLPMMVGALKNEGIDESRIKELVDNFIKKMPVGDLGEKLYPKSMFDEYYIHKTNFYLGQLRVKSFDVLFHQILDTEHDLSASYEFAGLLRLMYALRSEEELPLAEALAFFDLSAMKKQVEIEENLSFDELKEILTKNYEERPSRKNLVILMNLLTLARLKSYLPNFEEVLERYFIVSSDVPLESENLYPSLTEIKEAKIDSFDDMLLMIMHDLLNNK
ncbi:MAG: hypothetical protein ACVCEJ_03130 [Candidatus Izemoplasmataceae bacterium]